MVLEWRAAPFHNPRSREDNDDLNPDLRLEHQLKALMVAFDVENGSANGTWESLFLNQAVTLLEEGLIFPDDKQRGRITVLKAASWSPNQEHAIRSSYTTHGQTTPIQGATGCGKSRVLAAIAICLVLDGAAVVLVAPCRASARAAADAVRNVVLVCGCNLEISRALKTWFDVGSFQNRSLTSAQLLVDHPGCRLLNGLLHRLRAFFREGCRSR